jgi:uncharacterized protein with HEPN domain
MSKRGDIEYLIDIREAMGRIEIYIKKIDYKLVWETIKKRIPKIKPQINQILKKLEYKIY